RPVPALVVRESRRAQHAGSAGRGDRPGSPWRDRGRRRAAGPLMRRASNRPAGRGADTPPIECAVAALCAVILFGIVGYLFWHALVRPSGPPEIAVEAVATPVTDGGYLVEFVAVNRGPRTAA